MDISDIEENLLALLGADVDNRWNLRADIGTPVVVTYNFPQSRRAYDTSTADFAPILPAQIEGIEAALASWADVSGIVFVRIPDDQIAEITFTFQDMAGRLTSNGTQSSAYSFYPSSSTYTEAGIQFNRTNTKGGDVFLNLDNYGLDPDAFTPGNTGYSVVQHEIGHAIGLEHPHEGSVTIDPAYDSGAFTIMSYNRDRTLTELGSLDIEAVQLLYGAVNTISVVWDTSLGALVQTGTQADEYFFGQSVPSKMIGGDGDDRFYRPSDGDTIEAGDGEDVIVLNLYKSRATLEQKGAIVNVTLNDGTEFTIRDGEKIEFVDQSVSIANSLDPEPSPTVTPNVEEETDPLNVGENLNQDPIIGGETGDHLIGSSSNDVIAGRGGADFIEGQAGDDKISGADGEDTIQGGDGHDVIGGGLGNDRIDGGSGDDTIGSGKDNDTIDAGDGNDRVAASFGDDFVDGGAGHDSLAGHVGADSILGGAGNDNIGGGYGNDTINGGADNDTIGAGQQEDVLYGAVGNDVLNGNNGNDTIYGDAGDDTISGGDHSDVMTGGDGADVFRFRVFNSGTVDRITDFARGEDTLEMRGNFAGLTITDHADGIQIEKNGHVIVLEGVDAITEHDFVFV